MDVIFVTTMWNEVSEEVGWEREQELQSDFWWKMINLGSFTHRFERTTDSAWKIINSLPLSRPAEHHPLQIRRETVDEFLPLYRTAAGRTLVDSLTNLMSGSKGMFKRFKKSTKKQALERRVSLSPSPTIPLMPSLLGQKLAV